MSNVQPQSRRGFADISLGQVHYRTIEPPAEVAVQPLPLVLLHQSPSSSVMWEPMLPYLAQRGYRVYAPDTPGYGESDRPPAPPSIWDYAGWIVEVMDSLGIERAAVVGLHTGACIACHIAALRPERVSALVLFGVPFYDDDHRARVRERAGLLTPSPDGQHLLRQWEARRQITHARDPDAYPYQYGTRSTIALLSAGARWHWGFLAVAEADLASVMPRVQAPVLVMSGERDDLWTQSVRAVPHFPNVAWDVIPDGSHDVVDEAPEVFAEKIDRFLHRKAAGG